VPVSGGPFLSAVPLTVIVLAGVASIVAGVIDLSVSFPPPVRVVVNFLTLSSVAKDGIRIGSVNLISKPSIYPSPFAESMRSLSLISPSLSTVFILLNAPPAHPLPIPWK